MHMRRSRRLAAVTILLATFAVARGVAEDDRVLQRIEDVTLGPEYSSSGAICAGWVRLPMLSIVEGTEDEGRVVEASVSEINRALTTTAVQGVRSEKATASGADIPVYFVPLRRSPELVRNNGFQYVDRNSGYFRTFWNERHEIQSGIVLLASVRLSGTAVRHFALEAMSQVSGLLGDFHLVSESMFYAQDKDGRGSYRLLMPPGPTLRVERA